MLDFFKRNGEIYWGAKVTKEEIQKEILKAKNEVHNEIANIKREEESILFRKKLITASRKNISDLQSTIKNAENLLKQLSEEA